MHLPRLPLALVVSLILAAGAQAQDRSSKDTSDTPAGHVLPVNGRITDGEKKLAGCQIQVFRENELLAEQVTDKTGKFNVGLEVGDQYGIVFQREGFVPKRIIVDTRAELPKGELVFEPLDMEVSMLKAEKYDGADTDALDFPFAIVRWDKRTKTFAQDQQYTMDMMRTNGALLLMAGRTNKP